MKVLSVSRIVAAASVAVVVSASLVACSTDPERAKREYVKSGDRYFEQKKYAEAIVQYRNAIQHDARFGPARYKLAEAYAQIGDGQNAFREYIRAADAMPDSVEAQVKASSYLLAVGRLEEARTRAEAALKRDPKNVTAQILLGNSLAGLKDFDAALQQLEEAVRLDPTSVAAFASLGRVQLVMGSSADAEHSFRKAVETNPKSASAHTALAQYLWAAHRWDDAEASLRQAIAVEPQNVLAHRAMAAWLTVRGRIGEAEPHLKALADSDSSASAQFKLVLADYYITVNKWDEALGVLKQIAEQGKSSSGAAAARLAAIDFARKNPAEGNRRIDEVLARDPKNVPALLVKARFLMGDGKRDDALKLAQTAAATDPRSLQAHYLLGMLYRSKNQPDRAIEAFTEVLKINPQAAPAQLHLSELNLARGANELALQFARDAVRQLPRSGMAQLALIRGLLGNRDLRKAEETLRPLLAQHPNSAQVQNVAGSVALGKRDAAGARRAFARAWQIEPGNYDALAGLVVADVAEKKLGDARARVEEQLARTPNDPRVLLLAAGVFVATDAGRAEQLLRRSIELDASNIDAFAMLAQLYLTQKRLPEARANLEAIVRNRPAAAGPQTMLAILYQAEGNLDEARRRYEHVVRTDPTAAVAANNLAVIYSEHGGNLDVALQLAQTAKQHLPDRAEVSDTLGWIYVRRGLPSMAVPYLEHAVSRAPNSARSHYHLGVALSQMGETERARRSLERALSLNLEPKAAAEARKLIQQS